MAWSGWTQANIYGGCLLNTLDDGTWIHHLVALSDERNPDQNHVHLKVSKNDSKAPIVAAVKVDGLHEINRRELIDNINRATGLGLSYR